MIERIKLWLLRRRNRRYVNLQGMFPLQDTLRRGEQRGKQVDLRRSSGGYTAGYKRKSLDRKKGMR